MPENTPPCHEKALEVLTGTNKAISFHQLESQVQRNDGNNDDNDNSNEPEMYMRKDLIQSSVNHLIAGNSLNLVGVLPEDGIKVL